MYLTSSVCCSDPTDGAEVVARMLEHFARHPGPYASLLGDGLTNGSIPSALERGRSVTRAGAGRLRDAIVFGYMMQRHKARGKVCQFIIASSSLTDFFLGSNPSSIHTDSIMCQLYGQYKRQDKSTQLGVVLLEAWLTNGVPTVALRL